MHGPEAIASFAQDSVFHVPADVKVSKLYIFCAGEVSWPFRWVACKKSSTETLLLDLVGPSKEKLK